MKEDSRKYAWVAVLAVGLLLLAGGAFLLLGGSSGPIVGSAGLTPVVVPATAPGDLPEARRLEPVASEVERLPGAMDREAQAEEEAQPSTEQRFELRLSVSHANGRPAHGALCVVVQGEDLVDLEEADEEGRCSLRGHEGAGELLVFGATVPTYRLDLEDCRGERDVMLPAGAAVAGILLVDGIPPSERSIVEIDHWEEGFQFLDADPRWRARIAERESEWAQPVAADGTFRFSGLSEDWSGSLDVARELWLEGGGASVELDRPREGIVLRARRRPRIEGRVLLPDGKTPAPFAVLQMKISSDRASQTWGDAADASGRFSIGIVGGLSEEDRDSFDRVEIEIHDVDRVGYAKLDLHLEPRTGKPIGDIVLSAARDVPFRAIDDLTGEPVEGALAYSGSNRSELTDAEGRSILRGLRPDRFEFHALSIAHAEVTVPAPLQISGEIDVRLEPATILEILVSTPDELPVADLGIQLRGDCEIFRGEEPTHPSSQHIELGASDSGNSMHSVSSEGQAVVETNFETDAEGFCLLVGIDPECSFRITVNDVLHHPLYSEEDIRLRRGQYRRIDVVCPNAPRTLRGFVRDELGNAIPGARVFARSSEIQRKGGSGPLARRPLDEPDYYEDQGRSTTDEEGSWAFKKLFASAIDLMVAVDGFETLIMKDVQVVADASSPLELILRQPRSLEIQVRAGEEVLEDRQVSLSAYVDGWRVRGLNYDGARWTLANPPDHEIVLHAYCAQRKFSKVILPTDSEVLWELPALGTVEVSWNFEEPHHGSRSLQLAPVGDPDSTLGAWLREGQDEATGTRTFRAFPGRYEALMMGRFGEDETMTEITTRTPITVEAGPDREPQRVELRRN